METKFFDNMPVVPLRGLVVFPYTLVSFDVGRESSVAAVKAAVENDGIIFLTAQIDPLLNNVTSGDQIYRTGCIGRISQVIKLAGDTMRVIVEGISRAEITEFISFEPFIHVKAEEKIEDRFTKDITSLRSTLSEAFSEYLSQHGRSPLTEAFAAIEKTEEDYMYPFRAANLIMKTIEERQDFIECSDYATRCLKVLSSIAHAHELAKLSSRIEKSVKAQVEQNQKEYILHEQIKAIQKELGETEAAEAEDFRKRLNARPFPKEIRARLEKEISQFSALPPGSHEMPSLRTFIDCLLDMPYTEKTEDNLDIENARKILDEDHYGLQKVKERILEYLAVAKLTGKPNGQIICFAGPPGVGKTSISSSIARALGRKFVRMSLGGISDEAEIRGHRRTYIGAMPGRIINAMRQAGTINPVILMDEIDKLSHDYHGDPAAAILEVLDGAQNNSFRDNFLEMPYDLSKVMFITTANDINNIPRPLLDRMEVIEVSSYLENEKAEIALRHLIPKQLEKNGLTRTMLSFTRDSVYEIIEGYTREAGVRNLERTIASVCRKAAVEIANGKKRIRLSISKVHEYLGPTKFSIDKADPAPEIGLVNGLAWTSVGGETLEIEVRALKGTGQLQLTGSLGNVMQESAKTAITCVRACADKLGLPEDFNQHIDIHIHVPEGAVPKDGPSAGITMFTAVASALTGIPVKPRLAMTGEITLRGRVLPIGGLREKLLAAERAGIKTVIVSEQNKKDMEEIPADILDKLEIVFVRQSDEVLRCALMHLPNDSGLFIPADNIRLGASA